MLNQQNDYRPVFWAHLTLLAIILISPLFFSWWLIAIAAIVLWIQNIVIGGCILTFQQFGKSDPDMTFWYHVLTRLKLKVNKRKVKITVRYILPFVIITLALLWQKGLSHDPLLF
jgi:hypothetical protein